MGIMSAVSNALCKVFSRESHRVKMVDMFTSGPAIQEAWKRAGRLHRTDGPAFTLRDVKTGTVIYESWEQNGILNRDDAPAVIRRDNITGCVRESEWWKNGERIAAPGQAVPIF